jgi:ABC-2 type transport system ATP-binding protein
MMGMIDDLLAKHVVLSGPTSEADRVAELFTIVQSQRAGRQTQFVARIDAPLGFPDGWVAEHISLGELVLAYLREPSVSAMSGPLAMSAKHAGEVTR